MQQISPSAKSLFARAPSGNRRVDPSESDPEPESVLAFVLAFAFAFTLPLCRFARGGCPVMVGIGLRTGIALS